MSAETKPDDGGNANAPPPAGKVMSLMNAQKETFVHSCGLRKTKKQDKPPREVVLCVGGVLKIDRITHKLLHTTSYTAVTAVDPVGTMDIAVNYLTWKPKKQGKDTNMDAPLPSVRTRAYTASSTMERDEFVNVFNALLANFWHRTSESWFFNAPQVYQTSEYAIDPKTSQLIQAFTSTSHLVLLNRREQNLCDLLQLQPNEQGKGKTQLQKFLMAEIALSTIRRCLIGPQVTRSPMGIEVHTLEIQHAAGDVLLGFPSSCNRATFTRDLHFSVVSCGGSNDFTVEAAPS